MATLTLLVLRCRDLERSKQFYMALGLVFIKEQHGSGPLHYSSQLGTTLIELYPATSSTSSVRLGLAVNDVAAILESVRSLGFAVEHEPTVERPTCVVRDPDDNRVELSQT
jgi:catechol 2,3-dioxygenase-like lactoylglutathione lyase family enzyme